MPTDGPVDEGLQGQCGCTEGLLGGERVAGGESAPAGTPPHSSSAFMCQLFCDTASGGREEELVKVCV